MAYLLTKDGEYHLYSYEKEEEFEDHVKEHSDDIFGESSIYFDVKQLMRTKGFGAIPDAFLADLSIPENPVLYVVENELLKHTIDHIVTQIVRFGMTYDENKQTIHKMLLNEIERNPSKNKSIKKMYGSVSKLLQQVIFEQDLQVLIVIDRDSEALQKALSKLTISCNSIEFETFVRGDKLTEDHLHRFSKLNEVALEPTEAWTELAFDFLDDPKIDKKHFLKKHKISTVQAFAYTRDKSGKIDGIVLQGYKNRIERALKKGIKNWDTAKPIRTNNLRKGMWIHIGETDYDPDTGEHVKNPKIRVRGRLKKVYRIVGKKKEKIFP